jgi:hypothetical protein
MASPAKEALGDETAAMADHQSGAALKEEIYQEVNRAKFRWVGPALLALACRSLGRVGICDEYFSDCGCGGCAAAGSTSRPSLSRVSVGSSPARSPCRHRPVSRFDAARRRNCPSCLSCLAAGLESSAPLIPRESWDVLAVCSYVVGCTEAYDTRRLFCSRCRALLTVPLS